MKKIKRNYLNNKDILKEIHLSKITYCSKAPNNYYFYDHIIEDINLLQEQETWNIAKANRLAKIQIQENEYAKENKVQPRIINENFIITPLVVRVMCNDWIPRTQTKKGVEKPIKLNFPPFKHFINDPEITEVVRSHWRGDLTTGKFSQTHGNPTNTLCKMFELLVEKLSKKPLYNKYSYLDEMKAEARLQLVVNGLMFNEAKGSNPFSYLTQTTHFAFQKYKEIEKKQQNIRDDLLQAYNHTPSMGRQIDDEFETKTETYGVKLYKKEKEPETND